MSVYASIDAGEPAYLASNMGWGQFGSWADRLDAEQFAEVVHLREHGWNETAGLAEQLQAALTAKRPDRDTLGVVKSLLDILAGGGEVVTVNDGMSPA